MMLKGQAVQIFLQAPHFYLVQAYTMNTNEIYNNVP
jgi:hypothetical protein